MAIPTINTIKNSLATFASYHLQLKRFQLSFFEQFDAFSEKDIQFPLLYAIPQDVSMQDNINSFTMRIYCVDLTQSDRSNEVDIINDTLLILRDLRNWLQLADTGLGILNNPTAFPVNNFLISNTIGWYFDVEVEATADNSECSIPFSSNFLLSGNSCTYNYVVPYLTCDTLSSCQTILNIEGDITNIYSILSGITGNTGDSFWTSGTTGIYNTYQGNVGINNPTPNASLDVSGTTIFQNGVLRFVNSNSLAELLGLPTVGQVATSNGQDYVIGIADITGQLIGTMLSKDAGTTDNIKQIGVSDNQAIIEYLTTVGGTHNAIIADVNGIRVESLSDDGSTYVMKWISSGGTELMTLLSDGLADYPSATRVITYDGNNVLKSVSISDILTGTTGIYLPLSGGTMDDNAIIFLNNGSALQEGNYDFGGQGGISQICSVAYELNWQAGSEYVFDNNGLIRIAQFKFNTIPDVNSDSSQRFKVGSRWILDDGTSYICLDDTVGAAVWNLEINGTTVTGVTWSPNTLTVAQSDGTNYNATISAFTAFNYTDGGQQLGRVLTSDANGNASWQVQAVGTSLTYFFNNLSAGTNTYYQAKTDVQTQALETITNLNVVNNQFLAGFITDAGQPGLTFIPGGIVNLHIHAANTNSGKATELYFELYKRTTGGTETLLGQSNLTPTLGGLQSGYETELSISATTLNVTDRFVTKVYARVTGGGPAPHIDLYLADGTLSRVQIPTPILNFNNYVPYSGATGNVNLGTHSLIATTLSATTYQGLPVYQRLNDNDIVNFFNYCGLAISGTSQNDPTWQISRISWSSTTPTTQSAFGAWSGRTSLIYS